MSNETEKAWAEARTTDDGEVLSRWEEGGKITSRSAIEGLAQELANEKRHEVVLVWGVGGRTLASVVYSPKPRKSDGIWPTLDDLAHLSGWLIWDQDWQHREESNPGELVAVFVSESGLQHRLTESKDDECEGVWGPAWLVNGNFSFTESPFWLDDLRTDYSGVVRIDHDHDEDDMCCDDMNAYQFIIPSMGATELQLHGDQMRCCLCHLEETGKADPSPKSENSPWRDVVGEGPVIEPHRDPTSSYKLSCGHTII